jgi:hypothetical protein
MVALCYDRCAGVPCDQGRPLSRVAELCRVLAAPEVVNKFDWQAIESALGLRLPTDYKELVGRIPKGKILNALTINRPGGDPGYRSDDFLGYLAYRLEDVRHQRSTGRGRFPYPLFPEPGGLLPWGWGPRVEPLYWLTNATDPDSWPVVVADYDCTEWQRFEGGVCEFLLHAIKSAYDMRLQGIGEVADVPPFTPEPAPHEVKWGTPGPRFWTEVLHVETGRRIGNDYAQLPAIIGSPPKPVNPVSWEEVEQGLGVALPADYKSFADHYGAGRVLGITIATPHGPGALNLHTLLERKFQQVSQVVRTQFDPPIYPEPMGMVFWGETHDGYTLGWVPINADPDRWPTVIVRPDTPSMSSVGVYPDFSFSTLLVRRADPDGIGLGHLGPWRGDRSFQPADEL